MDVAGIIKSVRLCIDEEADNGSFFADAQSGDTTSMDNIIKSRIDDALRWICLYTPDELLSGSDETNQDTGILTTKTENVTSAGVNGYVELPSDFVKLVRVRATGWSRAIRTPIEEDSDEYLQLSDSNGATATSDRPQAVIINKTPKILELWPFGVSAELTYVSYVSHTISDNAKIALPHGAKTSFIYYLAFLVLSAYQDSRAERMLEIAKMNIGVS